MVQPRELSKSFFFMKKGECLSIVGGFIQQPADSFRKNFSWWQCYGVHLLIRKSRRQISLLFALYVYLQLYQEWNYVRKWFTNFLLASPASLEKYLELQLSCPKRKNYVHLKATLVVVWLSFTYNGENNSLPSFQSILQFLSEFC